MPLVSEENLQILSKELKFNEGLILSNKEEKIKKIIDKSIESVENLKENLSVKKIIYPNDYVFASLANRVYEEKKNVDRNFDDDLYGKAFDQKLGNWQLLTVAYDDVITSGYIGAAYWNPDTQQIIIAHRGTDPKDFNTLLGTVFTDIKGIFLNQHVYQIDSAVTFTEKIISVLREIKEENRHIRKQEPYIQLFFTGHSLGGFLAQITTFTAKYLIRDNGNFVENKMFEETGYHASTVIFDSPGGRDMLVHIRDKFMDRYGSYLLDSLDIISYLSAPNLVNACRPQIGEVYRIHTILTEEEKKQMQASLKQYISIAHKRQKFKEVFDPETGEVRKDGEGKLRIEKVYDWPLLVLEDEIDKKFIRDKIEWGIKELLKCILPAWMVMLGKFAYSVKQWYDELNQELNVFFALANKSNNYHLDEESARVQVGEKYYRIIRYRTEKLNCNYKNERSLNVFTQPERKFLEEYKFLERCEESLPGIVILEGLFNSFKDNKLMSDTKEMLKGCTIESGIIYSENLQRFIPYMKHILHFFPKMKQEVSQAYQNFPSDLHNRLYQLISTSYLNIVKNSLDFREDYISVRTFIKDNNLKFLHTVESCTSLGATRVYKTFNMVKSDYSNEKHHVFLNLDRIFYLGEDIFISFLKKIDYKYLLVVECDNDEAKEFLEKLFSSLQDKPNIKVILVTERGCGLSKFISESKYMVNNLSKCQEVNTEVRWNDLTSDSQKKLLDKKVIFQGKEVSLSTVVNNNNALNRIIDPETIVELFKNKKIEIGKPLPSLGETEYYYIERKLVKKVKVKKEVLEDDNLTDLFAVSNISTEELLKLTNGRKVRSFNAEDPDKSNPVRFIALNENAEKNFKILCDGYLSHTTHWLKKDSEGNLIWEKSHGKTISGLRRYLENYENDLPEHEYLESNISIKMVNVNDINKFDEKLIVIAAEPGMGKTTALTRLGTQRRDDSKWLIRINLVDYRDKLEQRNFSNDNSIVVFLHEINIVSNTLTKNLLEFRLKESGNIVFLLDGFDEINSVGQKNIVNLIKKLQETKVEKVLISTRLHLRNELENSLSTIAYTLKPFFRKDQAEFLQKFWQRDLSQGIGQELLDNYINKLLEFVSNSIGDKERRFMGIPMQMRMVAEAFQEVTKNRTYLDNPECTFPKNFDVLKLYDRFLCAKYQVYFRKRGAENIDLDYEDEDWLIAKPTKVHRRLALKVLFPEIMKDFIGKKLPSEKDKQSVNRVGIAQCINESIVFTHRTFAEYFVAGFLADKLGRGKGSKKYETVVEFLSKELFENKNEVIRTFLDYHLAKEKIHAAILKGKLDNVTLSEENINVIDILGRSALHYAAQEGHKEIVDALKNNVDITKTDELGKTALHYAARYNYGTEVISSLLEKAEDYIDKKDKNGCTSVSYAAQQGNWDIVDFLIEKKGASVDGLDTEKLLFHYTYKGSLNGIQKVVEKERMDISAIKDNHDNTLLQIAAQKGHLTVINFLLEKGADVTIANNSGKRPINYAAEGNHWNIVESLLRKNAEFNHLSVPQKLSLLNHSAKNAHWDIVKLFMEDNGRDNYLSHLNSQQRLKLLFNIICFKDLDSKDSEIAKFVIEKSTAVNSSDGNDKRLIHYAAANRHWSIVESLLRNNANFNDLSNKQKHLLLGYSAKNSSWDIIKQFMIDTNRYSYFNCLFGSITNQQRMCCLSYFISIGDLEVTKFFIERLIEEKKVNDVNIPNSCGKTFLHLASQDGKLNIVQYFVDEKGANLNTVTSNGSTPLHLAAKNGHIELVKYFIDKQANIHAKDNDDKIPLDLAAENNHFEIVGYFKEEVAKIFYKQCKYGEALKSYQEVFDIRKRPDVLGLNHPYTITTRLDMAEVLFEQGKYEEAYQVYLEVFDIQRRKDTDHPDTLRTRMGIANVLLKQGNYSKALETYREIFSIRERHLGSKHHDTLKTQHHTAEVLFNQGKYSDALQIYTEVFDIQKRPDVLGLEHPDTLTTRHDMAVVFFKQGKYKEAYQVYQEVFDIQKRRNADHPDTVRTRIGIANVLFKQGNYSKALETYQEVFDIQERCLGSEHPETLRTQHGKAEVLFKQGKYEEAYKVYQEIFEIQKKRDTDHPDTLRTCMGIANVLFKQGNYSKALETYQEVLDIQERHLGSEHPDTLKTRYHMAGVLSDQGKYNDAMQVYTEILNIQKDVLGPDHPDTLSTCKCIANGLFNQGKYSKALQGYTEVYNIQKKLDILGLEHPDTLETHNSMADVFYKLGQDKNALNIYKEVFDIQKRHLGSEHPDTLRTHNGMARVLSKQGKYNDAFKIYQEVFKTRSNTLGPGHPDTLKAHHNMALELSQQGKCSEALQVYTKVFNIQKRDLGPEHPDTLRTHHNMAVVLSKQGKYSDALQIYTEVFNIKSRPDVLGPDHPDTLTTRRAIAQELFNQGKYSDALQVYIEVYNVQKRLNILGLEHPDTLGTRNGIADVFYRQGQYEKALNTYTEVFDVQKRCFGSEHPDTLSTLNRMARVFNAQGRHSDALQVYQEIFDVQNKNLGPEHPKTLEIRHFMALALCNEGKYSDALQNYQELFDLRERHLGSEHPDTLRTRHNIALVLSKQDKYIDALQIYQEVFDVQKRCLGSEHPDTLLTSHNIEIISRKQASECSLQ